MAPPTKEIETTETIHFNTPEDYKNRQHFINEIGGGNRKTDYNVDKHNTNIISYDILDSGNNDESKKKSRKFGSGFMASSKASLPLMLQSESISPKKVHFLKVEKAVHRCLRAILTLLDGKNLLLMIATLKMKKYFLKILILAYVLLIHGHRFTISTKQNYVL